MHYQNSPPKNIFVSLVLHLTNNIFGVGEIIVLYYGVCDM